VTLSEPVIGADLFIAPTGNQLIALALPGGEERWRFDGNGVGLNPPIVAGDRVLWLTLDETDGQSLLSAVDLATGALLWQIPGPTLPILGGLAADSSNVYLSTPPSALDLATGALRWQLPPERIGLDRPLLSEDGRTLFVGLIHDDGNTGLMAALNPADGTLRWEVTMPGLLGPLEEMWQWHDLLIVPLYLGAGEIVALDINDGAQRWRYRPPVSRLGTVSLIGDRLWVPLQDGRTVLLDAASGEKLLTLGDAGANLNSYSYAQRPAAVDGWVLVPMVDQLRFYREP
jgi:outer membrane protein assembly factor BamB